MTPLIHLEQRLSDCAALWAEANLSSTARLGRIVANDTSFFTRLNRPGASTTIYTASRFARFMVDPANWPDGVVPEDVFVFAHMMGISTPQFSATTGKTGEISTQRVLSGEG